MSSQYIGIDFAKDDSDDFTAIANRCENCNKIIEIKVYANKDEIPQAPIYKNCPLCGVKFEKHIICE